MNFKTNVTPKTKLKLNQDYSFNNIDYKKGHEFHVIGFDYIRGYDIEDDFGNEICEIRMIMDKFEEIK